MDAENRFRPQVQALQFSTLSVSMETESRDQSAGWDRPSVAGSDQVPALTLLVAIVLVSAVAEAVSFAVDVLEAEVWSSLGLCRGGTIRRIQNLLNRSGWEH